MFKIKYELETVDDPRPLSLIFRMASGFIVLMGIISAVIVLFINASEKYTRSWWLNVLFYILVLQVFSYIAVKGFAPTLVRRFFRFLGS